MNNIIIMNANRIANKQYQDSFKLTLEDFGSEYMHNQVMPRRAVEMCDVFIATDEHHFKIVKCRVPNIPTEVVLPLSYLEPTIAMIHAWQPQ